MISWDTLFAPLLIFLLIGIFFFLTIKLLVDDGTLKILDDIGTDKRAKNNPGKFQVQYLIVSV